MPGPFVLVATSERYGFEVEERMLREDYPDLDVELRGAMVVTEDELVAAGAEADGMLVSTREAVTRRVLENLPRCKVIARYGVGLDNVDLDAATDAGIVVTHFPEYCTNEVADHAFTCLLALNRRLVELDRDLRAGSWVQHGPLTATILRGPVPALRELTLGVVGFGRIGREVVARAKPFRFSILVTDPYVDPDVVRAEGGEPVELNDLLARSDLVTLHCPLTPETRALIGTDALARMKPSAFLVNTARGPIVDLDALVVALSEGRLAGAALDVVYPEPLPLDSPLYTMPNVILTPHAAYYSERSVQVVREETFAGAMAVLRGIRPRVVANPRVLERVSLAPLL